MTAITLSDLTQTTIDGTGVFDSLMRAHKAHLEAEYNKQRIKGPEYSTVYLGSLNTVMGAAMQFLLQREKVDLEAQLLAQQLVIAKIEEQKVQAELAILQSNLLKIPVEILHVEAQTLHTKAQTAMVEQQKLNLIAELAIITQNALKIPAEILRIKAETANVEAKTLNVEKEGRVLENQICKLKAEFDLLVLNKAKTTNETALLAQKVATEKAQISFAGVDDKSIVGAQRLLYKAQREGFQRDAEQKAATILVGTWNTRRMTNDTEINTITDGEIGVAVTKLLSGLAPTDTNLA